MNNLVMTDFTSESQKTIGSLITQFFCLCSDGESLSSVDDFEDGNSSFNDRRSEARDSILGESKDELQNESHA